MMDCFVKANAHIHSGVAQIKSMSMALAAIADDGDLLVLNDGQIGVLIVINCSQRDNSLI